MTQVTQAGVTGGNVVASKLVNFTYNGDGQFSTISRYAVLVQRPFTTGLMEERTPRNDGNITVQVAGKPAVP